jgi:hypothetical protein
MADLANRKYNSESFPPSDFTMHDLLNRGLHSRRGVVRKGSSFLLSAEKRLFARRRSANEYAAHPPVLANSFPKSGTHLLDQIAEGLPDRVNYGAFLGSHISSFQYRLRTPENTVRYIQGIVPGELVRAHLHWAPLYDESLAAHNAVHYFIYRDLRDVVVSSSQYLRYMNRWHRLSPHVRALPNDEESIRLFITGLSGEGAAWFPNLVERFKEYEGWISCPRAYAVKFEDLVGPNRDARLQEMVEFYAARSGDPLDVSATVSRIREQIAPERSHTFRSGKRGGWEASFTPGLKDEFKRVAGDLLIRLGYERDNDW